MLQRGHVVVAPLLEREPGRANVLQLAVIGSNTCLVNNITADALALQRALLRFAAVASPFLASSALHPVRLENAGVVVLDIISDVGHAAVADLDSIMVEDLP